MALVDLFDPSIHHGKLPVRVLPYTYIHWFENITPDFAQELESEIRYNGMQAGIVYNIQERNLRECACINTNRQIELFENFNQYLWCICYSLLVVFDEGIQKPSMAGKFSGSLDLSNPLTAIAIDVFINGIDLISNYKEDVFFQLPNPEKYNDANAYYIELTNGVFTAAMTFVLLHEFAHQYYGHLDYCPTDDESKTDEYTADDYAIDKMAHNFGSDRGKTLKFGIVAGISSLLLLDKSLSGGTTHPDLDERLRVAIEKLELDEIDSLWGVAGLTFSLWMKKYNIDIKQPYKVESYKYYFYWILENIKLKPNN